MPDDAKDKPSAPQTWQGLHIVNQVTEVRCPQCAVPTRRVLLEDGRTEHRCFDCGFTFKVLTG